MSQKRKYKYRSIDTVDWADTPIVTGTVERFEDVTVEGEARPTIIIDTGTQLIRVWHSAGLDDPFKLAEAGDSIYIEYRGKAKLEGGRTFNRFNVSVWEGGTGDEEEVAKEKPKVSDPPF